MGFSTRITLMLLLTGLVVVASTPGQALAQVRTAGVASYVAVPDSSLERERAPRGEEVGARGRTSGRGENVRTERGEVREAQTARSRTASESATRGDREVEQVDRRVENRDPGVVIARDDDPWYGDAERREKQRQGPKFCANGEGHPVFGMAWCREKGFSRGTYGGSTRDGRQPEIIIIDRATRRADGAGSHTVEDILRDVVRGR